MKGFSIKRPGTKELFGQTSTGKDYFRQRGGGGAHKRHDGYKRSNTRRDEQRAKRGDF